MKKINTLLALLFLLLAFTTKLKFAIAGDDIRDTGGRYLTNGGANYYILAYDDKYGGLSVATIGSTLPRAVIQLPAKSLGLPVVVGNLNNTRIIDTDDRVNISPFVSNCGVTGDASWVLVNDEVAKVRYVGASCDSVKPINQIKPGIFQIKKNGLYYSLAYCGDTNTTSCDDDVGIFVDNAKNRRLAIGPKTQGFTFKFKNSDTA